MQVKMQKTKKSQNSFQEEEYLRTYSTWLQD